MQRQRSVIPCYWESQPSGCLKTHCPFLHTKPRPQLPSVKERVSQFKFAAIEIKSLDELRKGTNTDIPSSPTSSAPKQGFQDFAGGGGSRTVLKVEQSQRNIASFGHQNSSQFRFMPGQARSSASSQNHHTQSRDVQIVNRAQVKKEESKTKVPSFEFSTVLKDVKSRLNSSKTDEPIKSTSSMPSCTGNNAALTTGASGVPIPTVDVSSMRGSVFSQGRLEETSNSIFSPNFHQSSEHNNIVLTREAKISTDVQSSNKSTPTGMDSDESTVVTTQKRPRELELAKPDAKRVSYNISVCVCVCVRERERENVITS